MKNLIFLCVLLSFSRLGFSQNRFLLLDGKIDKYPIVMEVDVYEDTVCSIRYFYLNQRKDILLEGTTDKKGNIKVSTPEDEKGLFKEQFDLKKSSTGYTGSWTNGKKKLAVILKETSAGKYKNPYEHLPGINLLKKEEPYSYIKIAGLVFIKKEESKNGIAGMIWYQEKHSGISMPRIKSGYAAEVLKKINLVLLEAHLQESKNYLECSSTRSGEYDLTVNKIFSNKDLLSMNITVSYYCGGAHPDFGSTGLNFNTHTGELLKLDKVLRFGKTDPPSEHSEGWGDYRGDFFAPAIIDIFKKIYPEHMITSEEDCDYTNSDVWQFPNWYFTEKGLYLGAVFARAARACDQPEWSVIPYNILRRYLNPSAKIRLPE